MTDFLLELRSEEIPARMQDKARDDLARLFAAELEKAGLRADAIVTFATPRRLALIARDLPEQTAAVSDEIKGPRVGAPDVAIDGFLHKNRLTRADLVERDGIYVGTVDRPGRDTFNILDEAILSVVRSFPWPKSMRWGETSISTESLRWVRPLQGIVAIFGDRVIETRIEGITTGAVTLGHRFHHPGPITIGSAGDYEEKLRACHVIVDQDQRRALIRDRAGELAREAGLELIADEGLVAENAGLTEWPVPLLGRFDEAFLDVPPEVIRLTARVNQKYFVCRIPPRAQLGEGDHAQHGGGVRATPSHPSTSFAGSPPQQAAEERGRLANAFVCVANIDAADGGAAIVEGNRKVLAARLSDARFFYETDLKVPLAEQAEKLAKIVFHEKLGTVADKVERVAKLARWLVEEGIIKPSPLRGEGWERGSAASPPSDTAPLPDPLPGGERELLADLADRAARLAKADLVTGMVGEFPELQGVMGGYYAAAQGEHPAVAAAIRDHYGPVGQGDSVPTDPVTVAVSLADKLDTICGFFAVSEKPSGSRDPFALRRAAIATASTVVENNLTLPLMRTLNCALENLGKCFADQVYVFGAIDPAERARFEREVIAPYVRLQRDHPERVSEEPPSAPSATVFPTVTAFFLDQVRDQIIGFFADRLKVQQREAGVRHDLIDAVFAAKNQEGGGEDDLVSLLARVRALQAFVGTEDGANLLAGYKRAANILKKEGFAPLPLAGGAGGGPVDQSAPPADMPSPNPSRKREGDFSLSYTPESAENALIAALDAAEPAAARAVQAEDFEAAMAALASLRAPIDAFFDSVTVNDPDADKRRSRLALLARMRDAVHNVADFSKIEG